MNHIEQTTRLLGHICPNIMDLSLTTLTGAAKFRKTTQNNGYYAVQGHSRSSISVPVESPYTTSY